MEGHGEEVEDLREEEVEVEAEVEGVVAAADVGRSLRRRRCCCLVRECDPVTAGMETRDRDAL